MNATSYRKPAVAVIFVAIFGLFAGFHNIWANEHEDVGFGGVMPIVGGVRPFVQLVGTVYPASDKEKATRITTITIIVDTTKKEWLFKIKKAVDLTGDLTELGLINLIWPPTLRLWGGKTILAPLEKSDIGGKQFLIEGILNEADRILEVDQVRDLSKKTEKKE